MTPARYRFRVRPADTAHGYPYLVFDTHQRLHRPLTDFARDADLGHAAGTVAGYLHALLPWFTWLDGTGIAWTSPPAPLRQAIARYLLHHLHCKVLIHPLGFQQVALTNTSSSGGRSFLAALHLFYRWASRTSAYPFPHPLLDLRQDQAAGAPIDPLDWPAMPAQSGVAPPPPRRSSARYFRLVRDAWLPQTFTDGALYAQLLTAGQTLPDWRLRDTCVTRLLFETGARISEVCGLTLGDWAARGLLQEATAFSKGSHHRRVKFLRFSQDTAKLLRRYCDTERQHLDAAGRPLAAYLQQARAGQVDLATVPLFLNHQRTPLSPASYRRHAWQPACAAAGLAAHPHQARHWYVTLAVRQIHETAGAPGEIARRQQELIAYMGWHSGAATLAAYNHYFEVARHAEVQDQLHARMAAALQEALTHPPPGLDTTRVPVPLAAATAEYTLPADDLAADFAFLTRLGGRADAR